MGLPVTEGGVRLDADRLLERLETEYRAARAATAGEALELYHRAALTLRVETGRDGRAVAIRRGEEEGTALRTVSPGPGGQEAFAGASGPSVAAGAWIPALDAGPGPGAPPDGRWAAGSAAPLLDRDEGAALPAAEGLVEWLRQALDAIPGSGSTRPRPLEAWIEVAHTAESWVADGGLRASRTRARCWALFRPREPLPGDRPSKPVLVARRRFEDLPADAWARVLVDRRIPDTTPEPAPPRPLPVLFSPECAAALVLALTRHDGGATDVGSAWHVRDAPLDAAALFGGSFDDAGFATRSTLLADGRERCGRIDGPGHYRRASFRDRPEPLPAHLVVAPGPSAPPARCVLVTSLALHAMEPDRWLLGLEGGLFEGGSTGAALRPAFVSVDPSDLRRRCVAAVGPPRLSHLGVKTPALVVDGLVLQG